MVGLHGSKRMKKWLRFSANEAFALTTPSGLPSLFEMDGNSHYR